MKPATEILLSAAFALTPEENWNQRWQGADERGAFVEPLSPRSVSWCLLGAINAAAGINGESWLSPPHVTAAYEAVQAALGVSGLHGVADFNNTHAHAEVLDALYRAAEIAEAS